MIAARAKAMAKRRARRGAPRRTYRQDLAMVARAYGRTERIGWIEPMSDGPDLTPPTSRTHIWFRDDTHDGERGERVVLTVEPYRPSTIDRTVVEEDLLGVPDSWTPDVVRAWLRDALWSMRAMRPDGPDPSATASHMPDALHEWESYGSMAMETRAQSAAAWAAIQPTREQITRMDLVLPDWLLMLDDYTERWCCLGVGLGFNLRVVADRFGLSHRWAREVQQRGFERIARKLNGGT